MLRGGVGHEGEKVAESFPFRVRNKTEMAFLTRYSAQYWETHPEQSGKRRKEKASKQEREK